LSQDIRTLLQQRRYRECLELAQATPTPEAAILGAQAAIQLDELAVARRLLDLDLSWVEPHHQAERLSLLGAVRYRGGDLPGFRQMAIEAANLAQTFITLLQLGRALPGQEGLLALREALARVTNLEEESQVAAALAHGYMRLGRYRDGLPYASLAYLRNPDAYFLLSWVACSLYGDDDTPLEDLAQRLESCLHHEIVWVRAQANGYLAEIHLMQGNTPAAQSYFEQAIRQIPPSDLPFFATLGVRIYQARSRPDLVQRLVQAARVAMDISAFHRGLVLLAQGMALFPHSRAEEALEQALPLLQEHDQASAYIAQVLLGALRKQEPDPGYLEMHNQWAQRIHSWFPSAVPSTSTGVLWLQTLGRAQLLVDGRPIPLRLRGLELLVLLVSQPEGWDREELSMALYGELNFNALKVEMLRLKRALPPALQPIPKPWRLKGVLPADFLELQSRLRQGDLQGSLLLYQGAVLTASQAPGVVQLRNDLDDEIRSTIVASGRVEALAELADRFPEQTEVWKALLDKLPPSDPRYPAVLARARRLERQPGS
jgi:tetratricopeptide (TPR) repeat protein